MAYSLVIADDVKIMRDNLANTVNWGALGFDLKGAFPDGSHVLEYLNNNPLDVALLDIEMLKVSGLDVATFIHSHTLPTKVVLLTAHRHFEYAQKAVECKVEQYLLKPIAMPEIRRIFGLVKESLDKSKTLAAPTGFSDQNQYNSNDNIMKIKRYVKENYDKELTLSDIAEQVFLNASYISRLFKEKTGMTFSEYLTDIRVSAAAKLLTMPDIYVYEVCDRVGYQNIKHFYKVFKQKMGCSPAAYRERAFREKMDS